jgi:hypothetical protein
VIIAGVFTPGIILIAGTSALIVVAGRVATFLLAGGSSLIAGATPPLTALTPVHVARAASTHMARAGIAAPHARIGITPAAFTLAAPLRRGKRLQGEDQQTRQRDPARDSKS